MTRPSKNTDKMLIKSARKLLPEYGCSGLNIRMVAEKAGVNLGMFHYYFKTKEEFLKIVLQDIYEEFFKEINLESTVSESPIENLKSCVFTIARFVRDNRELFTVLIKDAINGEKLVLDLVKENFIRHVRIVIGIAMECQKNGSLPKMPLTNLLPPLMASVVGPIILGEIVSTLENNIIKGFVLKTVVKGIITDDAIQQRLDVVFNGLNSYGRE